MKVLKTTFLFLMITFFFFLTGCTPSPASEDDISHDIEESISESYDSIEIESVRVIKRQTDAKMKIDSVWVEVVYDAANARHTERYILEYGLYNEGWILDSTEPYEYEAWTLAPMNAISEDALLTYYLPSGSEIISNEVDLESNYQIVQYKYVEPHNFCDIYITESQEFWFNFDHWYSMGTESLEKREDWRKLCGTWIKNSGSIDIQITVTDYTGSDIWGTINLTDGGAYTIGGNLENNFGNGSHSIGGTWIETQYWLNGYDNFGYYALVIDMDSGISISSGAYPALRESPFTKIVDLYIEDPDEWTSQSDASFDSAGWTDIIDVSAGSYHTAGLKSDGTVIVAGNNSYGQCDVSDWTDIIAISAGCVHTVGLRSDGTVVAAGDNSDGQCDVSDWTDIIAVSAGYNHTVGLKSDGTVVTAGRGSGWPWNVSDWTDIIDVSAGSHHTVGLRSDGTVMTTSNIVGSPDIYGRYLYDLYDVIDVFAIADSVVCLSSDGTVFAVGNSIRSISKDIYSWSDIVSISGGTTSVLWHVVGLKSEGTVIAAGDNTSGQCDVSDWTDIIAVSAGSYRIDDNTKGHTVGLKADGTVVAVGDNTYGQCDIF